LNSRTIASGNEISGFPDPVAAMSDESVACVLDRAKSLLGRSGCMNDSISLYLKSENVKGDEEASGECASDVNSFANNSGSCSADSLMEQCSRSSTNLCLVAASAIPDEACGVEGIANDSRTDKCIIADGTPSPPL
jgi:hypothetical protein